MVQRLPENLALLYEVFGVDPDGELPSLMAPQTFEVDGIEFVCDYRPESTATRFFIVKTPDHVAAYRALLATLPAEATVLELGIAEGGSAALTVLDVDLARLVAIDNEAQPLEALDEFLTARGASDRVRLHWGVDQADGPRLRQILEADLPEGRGLDLVVDDASHDLDLTRASFDILFPHLEPGGRYVIEDWNASHTFYDAVADAFRDPANAEALRASIARGAQAPGPPEPPQQQRTLSRIAFDLVLARASSGEALAEVCFGPAGIVVTRGPAGLDTAGGFALRDLFTDHFALHPDTRG